MPDLSKYRKFAVALVGVAAVLVAQLFPQYTEELAVVVSILTALGVYAVPNET
jgi:hypothetical protein